MHMTDPCCGPQCGCCADHPLAAVRMLHGTGWHAPELGMHAHLRDDQQAIQHDAVRRMRMLPGGSKHMNTGRKCAGIAHFVRARSSCPHHGTLMQPPNRRCHPTSAMPSAGLMSHAGSKAGMAGELSLSPPPLRCGEAHWDQASAAQRARQRSEPSSACACAARQRLRRITAKRKAC